PETVDSNPMTLLQRADNMDIVLEAVGALPMRQQQAFLLRAWEGYDTAQTAEIMGCAEGSVKTHYYRALNAIRARLGDVGTTAEDLT
ncbi:MAG: sigma factor-like helix-turn-helix DNA-binding protein, partial [Moraxellaceae bacterium]|nr:sigma factor-like helix-turn-helix DNA-binding protein [Moraxellaceae bacterium]